MGGLALCKQLNPSFVDLFSRHHPDVGSRLEVSQSTPDTVKDHRRQAEQLVPLLLPYFGYLVISPFHYIRPTSLKMFSKTTLLVVLSAPLATAFQPPAAFTQGVLSHATSIGSLISK